MIFPPESVTNIITALADLAMVGVGVYLALTVVTALAQAHLGAVTGQPNPMAEAHDKIILAVILLAVAASARQMGAEMRAMAEAADLASRSGVSAYWALLGGFLIRIIIMATGASLGVGLALGAFEAQIGALAGSPTAVANFITRTVMIVLTAVATIGSVQLVNLIFRAVA